MALRPSVNYLAAFAAVACIAIPWYVVAQKIHDVTPVRASDYSASAVVWGDRVFWSPKSFARWLRFHGASYTLWGQRHPHAQIVLRSK
jgi:hypothetical protein